MRFLRRLYTRARNVSSGRRGDDRLREEMESHIAMQAEENLRAGMAPAEARRQAVLLMGAAEAIREQYHEEEGLPLLEHFYRDLRYALRQLRKSPGFTLTAVLTLALGIGATTAIFTLVQQVMLQSLPVTRPDQLWRIGDRPRCCNWNGYSQDGDGEPRDWSLFSSEIYQLFRANTPGFQHLAALQAGNMPLAVRLAGSSQGPQKTVNGQFVSGNFFQTLGVSAWRGRLFIDGDDREGAPPVAVMSFHAWQQKYGSDPAVVGSTSRINGHAFMIVGIAPAGFVGAKMERWGMPDIWLPLATEPLMLGATAHMKNPRIAWLDLIGRVRPGTNPKALEAQLQSELHGWLAAHLADMSPQEKAVWQEQTLHLSPGGAGFSGLRTYYSQSLLLLMATAACVLLVACANIANLLLARGLKSRQQTAVRLALGASRGRLVQSALIESLTLSLMGGVAGVAVAWAGARLILYLAFHLVERSTWIPVHAAPSISVLLFALAISLLTGAVFGIAPAWMTSLAEPVEAMRGVNREVGGRRWAQDALVIAQAALSLVLLSVAALLGSSLRNLERQNFGFDPDGRYIVSMNSPLLSNYKPQQLVPLYRRIQDRLSAIPGVRGVGAATYAPMTGDQWGSDIRIQGKPEPGPKDDVFVTWTRITPGFFSAIGAGMLAGRAIGEDDNGNTRHVAVVNEAFAAKFFGNQNPIGRHFGPVPISNAGTYEIVGIVHNIHYATWGFRDPARAMYYIPDAQTVDFDQLDNKNYELWSQNLYNIVVWAPGHPPNMLQQVKKALDDVDPNLIVDDIQPYSQVIQAAFDQQNMIASLTWLFGAVGLLLAAIGLYGVTAYGVEQRRGEIGVRMALGADRRSVVAMVLRGAFWQVGIGLAIGIPAAIAAGYLVASQLFDVAPWNPLLLAVATLLLALAALAAALIPAQRAASIDPMQALRSE